MRSCIHRRGIHARLNGNLEVFGCELLSICTAEPSSLEREDGGSVQACSTCPHWTRAVSPVEQVFTDIIDQRQWSDGETVSGPGSSLAATQQIRQQLPPLFDELKIKSLLDIPCGDFHWMSHLPIAGIDYLGADVVRDLIETLETRHPDRKFRHLDLITDPLPAVDAILVRDCLVHLPYRMIVDALQNIVRSGARWLITTHFPGRINHDIRLGSWRPLDLTGPPFRLPPPHRVINEGCSEGNGAYADKSLAVWRIDDIRAAVQRMDRGPRLAIGMATLRDWPGVWATIQGLRLNHTECLDDLEIIVVDNDPNGTPYSGGESSHSSKCRSLCERIGTRYDHYTAIAGTAAAKGRIFELATAPAVLVIDCHVLLPNGVIRRLIDWFDRNPSSKDLWQGPCLGDAGINDIIGTHFAPNWGSLMYGQWAIDPRVFQGDDPFEIDMQGCGLFACRRAAWPGFHPSLRGFGPEEFHIHQRIRMNGGRCYCLPWLRWCHRFGNPDGAALPGMSSADRLRGHIITHLDTGAPDLDQMRRHFVDETHSVTAEQFELILNQTRQELAADGFFPLNQSPITGAAY